MSTETVTHTPEQITALAAMKRGQAIHASFTTATDAAPVFNPSPVLVELHAHATRLRGAIRRSNMIQPRLSRRLVQAERVANLRWRAEVAEFEKANGDARVEEIVDAVSERDLILEETPA